MNAKHLFFSLCIASASTAYGTPKQPQQAAGCSLVFVENKGQITDQYHQPRTDIDFRIGGNGVNLFVGDAAIHYQWVQPSGTKVIAGDTVQEYNTYRMDVNLVGANPKAQVIKEQQQQFHERYYTSQFGEWGAVANSYEKVTYKEVYPNIDWVLYVKNNTIEYDFVVREGGKVSDIKLQYSGTSQLSINKDGSLTATTPFGSVTEAAPISFQQADGKTVASKFVLNDNTISFSTDNYTGTLVIDPTLSWATYYGGGLNDYSMYGNLTGDILGNVFLSGYTSSTSNIATVGAYQATLTAGEDGYLAKFNNAGARIWATYYGGAAQDVITGAVCDPNGNVFISGYSNSSSGISTTGSYQTVIAGNTDAFLAKFDSSGVRQWASYFGGTSADQGLAITTEKTGNVYLTGFSSSTSGVATSGSHQTARGGSQDAFIAKFSNSGTRIWSTYYGGSSADNGLAIATDTSCNIYLTGFTRSNAAIATAGTHQTTYGGGFEAFAVKFDSAGVRQWGTYFGNSGDEYGYGIDVDDAGNCYIAGTTGSATGIASTGSHQSVFGGIEDGYIAKFNSTGNRIWSSYYGGANSDLITSVKCDATNAIFLGGLTSSTTNIATSGAYKDTITGTADAFITKFDTAGVRLWGTYFGGDNEDYAYSIFLTPQSELYVGGMTSSAAYLSTQGSHQVTLGGGPFDAFLAKFNVCELTAPIAITGADTVCPSSTDLYSVPAVNGAISYTWILPSGWSGSSATNTINIQTGTITDTIRVAAYYLCGTSDTIEKIITVYPMPTVTPNGAVTLCEGDSITLTSSSGITYQWLLAGAEITGATNVDMTVSVAGNYSVVVTSANGCTDTSLITDITVNPLPVPIITVNGSVLSTTTAYSSYQWNHNGSPITGATNASYTVTLNEGIYTVTVVDSNGCTGTSEPYTPPTGIGEINGINYSIGIYPNPADHTLYIETKKEVNISLKAIDGRLITNYQSIDAIDISQLPEGFYLLYFTDKNGLFIGTEKFVKQRY